MYFIEHMDAINENTGTIFIVRHGPTHDDDLCVREMKKIINSVTKFIQNNKNEDAKIHKVLTSPYERCDQTASLLMEKLNISGKRKQQTDRLSRIQNSEKWSDVHTRGYEYGKFLRSRYRDKNIMIVTHSSLLLDVVKGVVRDRELKKQYLHPCSVTVIKNGKLIVFNYGGWSDHE